MFIFFSVGCGGVAGAGEGGYGEPSSQQQQRYEGAGGYHHPPQPGGHGTHQGKHLYILQHLF